MSEYTDEQVNIGIAEFMGYTTESIDGVLYEFEDKGGGLCDLGCSPMYTKSLDALVPVWEKARIPNVCQFDFNRLGNNYEFTIFQDRPDKNYGNQWYAKEHTIQQAAAHATYKAILALGEKG